MDEKINTNKNHTKFMIVKDILDSNNILNNCNIIYIANPGSSTSKVYIFEDLNNKMFAVKVCDKKQSRISLTKEQENEELLKPYLKFHLPNIIGVYSKNNYEIMVSECKGIDTLYSSIIYNKQTLNFHLNIWNDILTKIMTMWNTSKHTYNSEQTPRNNTLRIQRIEEKLKKYSYNKCLLKELWYKKIIVNNQEFFSLSKAFELIKTINNPDFGVVCQGDPQPSNIIIDNRGHWYMVDWEWSSKNHDYRMMFSHLYGWWNTRMTYLEKEASLTINGDSIIIKYDLIENENIKKFQITAIKKLKKHMGLNHRDILCINKFLALLYFGDVRFISIWGKEKYFPVLIGEAIKTLNYCIEGDLSKINSQFTLIDRNY